MWAAVSWYIVSCFEFSSYTWSYVNFFASSALMALLAVASDTDPIFVSMKTARARPSAVSVELSGRHRTTTRTHSAFGSLGLSSSFGMRQLE